MNRILLIEDDAETAEAVTEDRKRGHMIRMDEGNMAVRTFER
ncbi:hypothetical protein ACFKHW_08095 [Bradyrhizobium lupini]